LALSLDERARRYALVRQEMAARDIDVLLVVGRDGSGQRGDHRYLAGYPIVAAFSHFVVFPREEIEPIFFSGSSPSGNIGLESGWVHDLRTSRTPQDEIVAELGRQLQGGRIGVTSTIPIPLYRALVAQHGDAAVIDGLECLIGPRLRKSAEELAQMRRSAHAADEAYALLREVVRPGITDFEAYGELRRSLHAAGCEYSMDIIDSGNGLAAGAPRGHVIGADTVVQIEITPAWEGYYSQLRVPFSARGATWPAGWARLLRAWQLGYDGARSAIGPGARASDVYAAAVEGVERGGAAVGRRAGHALGLEVDEFVSIDPDDQTVLEAGMVLVAHVPARDPDRQVMIGGTFIVTEAGCEELNSLDVLSSELEA
jgi:Xaa-Pro aminopeptidase